MSDFFTYSPFFQNRCKKNLLFFNFIDKEEKNILPFEIAPLQYSCSCIYLQNYKGTGNYPVQVMPAQITDSYILHSEAGGTSQNIQ